MRHPEEHREQDHGGGDQERLEPPGDHGVILEGVDPTIESVEPTMSLRACCQRSGALVFMATTRRSCRADTEA